jgi:hypothetical protein
MAAVGVLAVAGEHARGSVDVAWSAGLVSGRPSVCLSAELHLRWSVRRMPRVCSVLVPLPIKLLDCAAGGKADTNSAFAGWRGPGRR